MSWPPTGCVARCSKKRRAFHWRVGHPHPAATCALDIALVLESLNPVVGRLLLTQQVLRLGEDDFAYWGVD